MKNNHDQMKNEAPEKLDKKIYNLETTITFTKILPQKGYSLKLRSQAKLYGTQLGPFGKVKRSL